MQHIIAMYVFFVILIAAYFISKVVTKQSAIAYETDFINDFLARKTDKLGKSDTGMSIGTYLLIMAIAPIICGIVGYIATKNPIFSVIVMVAGVLTPEGVVLFLEQRVNKDFEEKYARSLEQLASSLRAGMTILQAVREVANNKFIADNIRDRYSKLNADLTMGIPIAEAFKNFADTTNSQDAKDVATAIDIQNEIGNHEAEVIMSIADDIHERIMLRKEVKSLFSGTKSMVIIMDFIPLGIIVFLSASNSTYSSFYFESVLHLALILTLVASCLIGSILNHLKMNKIIKSS